MKIHKYRRRKRSIETLYGSLPLQRLLQYAAAAKRVFYDSQDQLTKRLSDRNRLFIQWLVYRDTKYVRKQKIPKLEFRLLSAMRVIKTPLVVKRITYTNAAYRIQHLRGSRKQYNNDHLYQYTTRSNTSLYNRIQPSLYPEILRKITNQNLSISKNIKILSLQFYQNKKIYQITLERNYSFNKIFIYSNQSELLYYFNNNYSNNRPQNNDVSNTNIVKYKHMMSQNFASTVLSSVFPINRSRNTCPYKNIANPIHFGRVDKVPSVVKLPTFPYQTKLSPSSSTMYLFRSRPAVEAPSKSVLNTYLLPSRRTGEGASKPISTRHLLQSRQAINRRTHIIHEISPLAESKYPQASTREVLVYQPPAGRMRNAPPIPTFNITNRFQTTLSHRVGHLSVPPPARGQLNADIPAFNGDVQQTAFRTPSSAGLSTRREFSIRRHEVELSHKKQTTAPAAPQEEAVDHPPDEPSPLSRMASPHGIAGLPQAHQSYDLDDLTNQIMQKIESRLRTERERRGIFV